MATRKRGGGFRPLEEVAAAAGALLPHSGQGLHLRALAAWRTAVGERLDRSTRVAGVEGNLLTIQVPDPAYSESLKGMEVEILRRVRRQMGWDAPRHIRYEVSPGFWRPPQGAGPRSAAGTVSEPEPEVAESPPPRRSEQETAGSQAGVGAVLTEEDLAGVGDPEQRRRLLQVANGYLRRSSQAEATPSLSGPPHARPLDPVSKPLPGPGWLRQVSRDRFQGPLRVS